MMFPACTVSATVLLLAETEVSVFPRLTVMEWFPKVTSLSLHYDVMVAL